MYSLIYQQFTNNTAVHISTTVPENVTLFAELRRFSSLQNIFIDATCRALLFCGRLIGQGRVRNIFRSGALSIMSLKSLVPAETVRNVELEEIGAAPTTSKAVGRSLQVAWPVVTHGETPPLIFKDVFVSITRSIPCQLAAFRFYGPNLEKGEDLSIKQPKSRVGYTYKALAAATGLSARFWRYEVSRGRIPFVKFDRAVIILPDDLERYMASRRRVKSETQDQAKTLTSRT